MDNTIIDISPTLVKSKEYKIIAMKYDPDFDDILKILDRVKEFIIANDLIIYGGTALDMALRLCGDQLYPDDLPFDYDFYSHENVEHAYQIADILYDLGYVDTRVIKAAHVHTMRVDMNVDHYVADLSFQPKEVFDVISTLRYQNMRIVHPFFQRIDQHSALSFPYDNPPKEVIFARWKNDVKRLNHAAKYYPSPLTGLSSKLNKSKNLIKLKLNTFPLLNKALYAGFAAYALIYYHFDTLITDLPQEDIDINGIIKSEIKITSETITFDALYDTLEIMHFDIEKCADEIGTTNVQLYEPFGSLIPEKITGDLPTCGLKVIILGNKHRLITVNSIPCDGIKLRLVNAQPLLKYFLSMYYIKLATDADLADIYLRYYTSIIKMINVVEKLVESNIIDIADISDSPLFLSVTTYGADNVSLATQVTLDRIYNDLDRRPMSPTPMNYHPAKSNGVHPTFDYSSSHHFCERGRKITVS